MNLSRKLWTGIAVLTLALTVGEIAAVDAMARGARRWWTGEDGIAVRHAAGIVGGMVADRIQGGSRGLPLELEVANLQSALEPLTGWTGTDEGDCSRCPLRRAMIEARGKARTARIHSRLELREILRRAERQVL
jgi:hypothetical protein